MTAALVTAAQDRFYILDFSIAPGETKQVEIMLDNATAFTALQADIYLPEGLAIEQENGEYLFDLTDRKARNHTISSTLLESGAIRILIASQTLKEFSGSIGALVTFNLIADASLSNDQKVIEMKKILASEADRTEHSLPDATCRVTIGSGETPALTLNKRMAKLEPGEILQLSVTSGGAGQVTWTSEDPSVATVSASGKVTAVKSGLVGITATAANGGTAWCAIFVYQRGDVNTDGEISVADVTNLVGILMNQ